MLVEKINSFRHFIDTEKLGNAFFFFLNLLKGCFGFDFKHHIGKHFNCEYNSENTSSPDNICPGQLRIKLAKQILKNQGSIFVFRMLYMQFPRNSSKR